MAVSWDFVLSISIENFNLLEKINKKGRFRYPDSLLTCDEQDTYIIFFHSNVFIETNQRLQTLLFLGSTSMRLYFFDIKVKFCYWVTIVQNNFLILRSSDCPTAIAICERCRLCFEVFPPTVPTNFPLCLIEISAFLFHDFRFRFPKIKEKT